MGRFGRPMKKTRNRPIATKSEEAANAIHKDANPSETPSRRELIERYGKYAVVAPPLLLFVSRALGQYDPDIHSKP
jgi:hypothetical protein